MRKRLLRSPAVQRAIGFAVADYFRLVWKTNRLILDPPDLYDRLHADGPVIIAMWHGQHFMVPYTRRADFKAKVLISRHRDGGINAAALERIGIGTVRGSGDHERRFDRKGGVPAFLGMLDALALGYNMALTADVPKVARVAGPGVVLLAGKSGRPIYPTAVATSRRIQFDNWDRTTVNLPFGRIAVVVGEPVRVAADAAGDVQEAARVTLEERLNDATRRAYDLADGAGPARRG